MPAELKLGGNTVMKDNMKINKSSTTDNITVDNFDNAMIVGPFSGVNVTVNGSLCVTRSLTLSGTLTVASGKTLQVI